MRIQDRERFPEKTVTLRDGTTACLRFLGHDDGASLAALYENLSEKAMRFYWPHLLDREHALANASRADSPAEVVLVLAMPDASLGGYAWYRWRDADSPVSGFGICVAEAYRGLGIGRLLMERLLEIARDIGPPVMTLTCQHANFRAVNLYLKMGFRIVKEGMTGPRRQWPAEPQYWMERPVR